MDWFDADTFSALVFAVFVAALYAYVDSKKL